LGKIPSRVVFSVMVRLMKKEEWRIALIILAVIIQITTIMQMTVVASMFIINPARMPKPLLRTYMLMRTPVGTDIEDVLTSVHNGRFRWRVFPVVDRGLLVTNNSVFHASHLTCDDDERVVGVKSLRVYLGSYYTIFEMYSEVFYAFDEDSKLIDIFVVKYGSSP
jgi:hypothetical protein